MVNYWNLDNKATLLVEEMPYLKSVAIGIYIKLGSRHEPAHMSGASHFIEHMLFKGTPSRSARDIAESFEGIGGQLNAFTAKEYTCVYARTLDENSFEALDILFDMIFNSTFAKKDFDVEKGVVIEEINMYEDSPDDLIHDVFAEKLWENNSMGLPILGTLDSVTSFAQKDIYDFYKSCYIPSNLVISIAGNVNSEEIKDKIEELLINQPRTTLDLDIAKSTTSPPFINLVEKETEQVQICIGGPGISYFDPNRYSQNIMSSILGGGLSSRLFQKIREELGLAYSVYSYPSTYSDTGSYSIYIATSKKHIGSFFKTLQEELTLFTDKGVTELEVERTKRLMKSSIYLGMESVTNHMSRLGKTMLMYDKVIPVEDVISKIYAVSSQDVTNLANKILNQSSLSLAAIGSKDILPIVEEEFQRYFR
ncbi:MAG TPA: pitrilysin family protein [Syntrophomonadaceae bacterium]|nr:pitrilysin family protein [Syntrophomonadaceae bacterium]